MIKGRTFIKERSLRQPPRNRKAEREEYWREHKGAVKCPKCSNVHLKKRWYSSEEDLQRRLKTKRLEITETKLCPSCKMIEDNSFGGELFAEEFPNHLRKELLHLIKNFGKRAMELDPQDRIIKITETKRGYHVTTTENQLADKLAKKIRDVFNTVKIHFSHSPEPESTDRIHITFHGT